MNSELRTRIRRGLGHLLGYTKPKDFGSLVALCLGAWAIWSVYINGPFSANEARFDVLDISADPTESLATASPDAIPDLISSAMQNIGSPQECLGFWGHTVHRISQEALCGELICGGIEP